MISTIALKSTLFILRAVLEITGMYMMCVLSLTNFRFCQHDVWDLNTSLQRDYSVTTESEICIGCIAYLAREERLAKAAVNLGEYCQVRTDILLCK